MPLRIRIALFFAAATAVVLVAGGYAFIDQLSSGINHTIDSTLTTRAADIANAVAQQGADPTGVLEASSRAPLPLGGSAAQVLDRQGNVLSASNSSSVPMVSTSTIKLAEHGTLRFSSGTKHRQRYIVVTVKNRAGPLAIVVRSELEGSDEAIDRAERLLVFGGAPLVRWPDWLDGSWPALHCDRSSGCARRSQASPKTRWARPSTCRAPTTRSPRWPPP